MRALAAVLLLAVLATGAPGCALFGKREGSAERHGPFANWFKKKDSSVNAPPPKFPDPITSPPGSVTPPPTPAPTAQATNTSEALFAGQVIDVYNRPANNTYIRLVQLDGPTDGKAPVDVPTTGDGYFIIPGLKRGRQYQLIARTKQGDKLLAGITIRQAPDSNVVIQVKEELATSSIPPLPDPSDKKDAKPAASSSLDSRPTAPAIWTPTPAGGNAALTGQRGAAEVEVPAKLTVPMPTPAAAPNTLAPGVASTPSSGWPPILQIGPKKSTPPARPFMPQPPPLPRDTQSRLPPVVPSCVVLGKDVQTLALKDVDDQTWNFHKDRRGKVVLLDFWTPNCFWCRKAMPILSQMQAKYGPQGLEVVGVYIANGPVANQAVSAKQTCAYLQTNYRQVLGQDGKTRICDQFGVQNYPTTIILNARGHILWQHEGTPDPALLEQVLRKHLANQPF